MREHCADHTPVRDPAYRRLTHPGELVFFIFGVDHAVQPPSQALIVGAHYNRLPQPGIQMHAVRVVINWAKDGVLSGRERAVVAGDGRVVDACDPARFGNDETVIYVFNNTHVVYSEIYGKKDTDYTTTRLAMLSNKHGHCPIFIDEGGLGVAPVDSLRAMGYDCKGINGSSAPTDSRYGNLRAEIWDTVGQMMANGDVEIHEMDDTLEGQLVTPTYDFRRGKMWIQDKDEIKAKLGRSPDQADAYVIGVWASRKVKAMRSAHETRTGYNRCATRTAMSPAMAG